MKAIKVLVALVMLALCVVAVLYLAGVFYFLANKASPLNVNVSTWWEYYAAYGIGLPKLAGALLIAIALVICLPLALLMKSHQSLLHGESRTASTPEIHAAGLLGDLGIIVGKYAGRYLKYSGSQHVGLLSPTRSGKGVSCSVPNALSWPDSLVALDVKQELYAITSKYRSQFMPVYLFDPYSATTHRYNPLAYISADPDKRISDVLTIAQILYPTTGSSTDSMWVDQARSLFSSLCLMVLATEPENATIGNVLRHSSGKGKSLKDHLSDQIKGNQLSNACVDGLQRFINSPDVTSGGIVTQLTSALVLWQNPLIDHATSGNDFDLRQLRKRRMTVYIGVKVNKLAECAPLMRCLFAQLLSLNTDTLFGDDDNRVQCLLLMDEFAALGRLEILAKSSAYIAGYGLRLLLIAQSRSQLMAPTYEGGYGRETATAMLHNVALQIAFAPADDNDARELSESLGYRTVKSKTRQLRGYGGSTSDAKRALFLPQELKNLKADKQLIRLSGGVRPIMCNKVCYYNDPVFINLLKSVSPSLARLGKRLPTEQQLRDAWPELSAPIPTHDMGLARAKRDQRTRPIKPADVSQGIKLERLAVDLSPLPKHDKPMSDNDVAAFADDFMSLMGADDEYPDDADEPPQGVDLETGELYDLTKLRV